MQSKKIILFKLTVLFSILVCSQCITQAIKAQQHIYPPQDERWDADSLGNQRAVIQVKNNIEEVTIKVDWRNRAVKPNQKVYVIDSTTNKIVINVKQLDMSPENGIITFEPTSGKGIYYIYYLPYTLAGRSRFYPDAIYKTNNKIDKPGNIKISNQKDVVLVRLESVDDFNSNNPMEIIATEEEIKNLINEHDKKEYLVFPELREFPIKMKAYLPQRWIEQPLRESLIANARRGENFSFQLGIWPITQDLKNVNVTFTNLDDNHGNIISSENINCFNTEGTDYKGVPMSKRVDVIKGDIQPLWFGLQVPEDIKPGTYYGTATVDIDNANSTQIPIELEIEKEVILNGGIAEPWKQTRLIWINSTLAQENTVIEPYIPLEVSGNTISLLGRKLTLDESGLPKQIETYFTEEMTTISSKPKNILSAPFEFIFLRTNGNEIRMTNSDLSFLEKEPGTVKWHVNSKSSEIEMNVTGSIEFDGYVNYEVEIVPSQTISLKDISMIIPMNTEASKYILGLGHKGGYRPGNINWKWDVAYKNHDGAWIGDVNAGIQFTLKDQNYERPLNTNFYLSKPLRLPGSWGNENKGGIDITQQGNKVLVNNYSGTRTIQKGDTLYYNFNLLITPFHTLQTDAQWNERYYHAFNPIDSVLKSGSNVINIHHANKLNPYINYPFIATKEMKAYINSAHHAGLKVKIYNTVREVSNRMYELYPLKSLGDEIFTASKEETYSGSGYSWLQEHLVKDYIGAWFVPGLKDAAIINSGMSRWHNYYVEGMNWLVDNIGIDGIYLDDVAFDRVTMKRIKRVMTKNNHPGIIDLHSANQFNERDGFINSAHLYMEHFPYINRLWFGEYFDYEKESPDFFMTEVSGIPFGLMGEMLQDGGNQWRGMIYGMTNRMPYQNQKPDQIWKLWDLFGMEGSRMIGYWVNDRPVRTNKNDILATTYLKDNKVLVALASWAPKDSFVKLIVDWNKLGINPDKAKIWAPEVKDFQSANSYNLNDEILIEKNKGMMLIIEEVSK